jgi:transcriptional regulator with XRE-family HTH domain
MNKVKELREQKGITQEQLSDRTSLRIATISKIENGHTKPHGVTLRAIAQVLGVTVKDLR